MFYLVHQLDLTKCISNNLIDLNVLWEQIVAVGAVVKDDLVEGGGAKLLHLAVVITAIFVFTDHPLPNWQIPHRSLCPLEERTRVLVWLWYRGKCLVSEEIKWAGVTEFLSKQRRFLGKQQFSRRVKLWDKAFLLRPTATTLCVCVCVCWGGTQLHLERKLLLMYLLYDSFVYRLCFRTSATGDARCLGQVTKTMKGQSSGCMRTPAAWAQVGWNAVEQRPWEHWMQQPFSRFIRFLQYTHFYTAAQGGNVGQEEI